MSAQTESPPLWEVRQTRARADALLILLNARFVDPAFTAGAMRVLGLSKEDMSEARRRVGAMVAMPPHEPVGSTDSPSADQEWGQPPTGLPRAPHVAPSFERFRRPSKPATNARPVNHDGQLRCSKCQKWKDEDEFSLRTDRLGSGTRRSACKPCHRLAGKQRYLNVDAKGSLTLLGVDFVVEEGDTAGKFICAKCGKPIEQGDDATVIGVVEHSWCVKGEEE